MPADGGTPVRFGVLSRAAASYGGAPRVLTRVGSPGVAPSVRLGRPAPGGTLARVSRFDHALVTGASSGLGRAISLELARDGVELVLAARRETALRELAEEIREAGGRAHPVLLDVTDPDAVRAAVLEWDERLGGLDLVLANAGIAAPRAGDRDGHRTAEPGTRSESPAAALEWTSIEAVLEVNLLGACATLSAAIDPMRSRGRGTLAAVTSLAAERGMPGGGAYSASKAGLSRFLETMRIDLAGTGLEVVELRPGFVRTPMTAANDFEMPFLLEAPDAARRCVRALERGRPVCAFPAGLAWPLVLARLIPAGLWQKIASRGHPRGDRRGR